jgi:tetratricopeptide (TPR) repeat protein
MTTGRQSGGAARLVRFGPMTVLLVGMLLTGCASWPPEEGPRGERDTEEATPGAGPALPPESPPAPWEPQRSVRPVPLPPPEREPAAPPSYLAAGEALVEQARREVLLGDDALAGATLERALRIDGSNPWIWIELGHLRLAAGQHAAAESMARKALSLASRDPGARGAAASLLQRAGGG